MVAGVDPTGRMDEPSAQETTSSKVEISRVLVRIVLIVLVVSMTKVAPEQAAVVLKMIGV